MRTREATVVFADLDGYTALTEAHGDLDAAEVATRFAAAARALLPEDGRLVKSLGDAVMITTATPGDAFDLAVALISRLDAFDDYPSVSVGMHHGPVVEQDDDLYGRTVNLAARIAAEAAPRQVLCTEAVADALDEERRRRLRPAGPTRLRNVPTPVMLYAATVDGEDRPVDPVCRMHVDPARAAAYLQHDGDRYFCSTACARAFLADPDAYRDART